MSIITHKVMVSKTLNRTQGRLLLRATNYYIMSTQQNDVWLEQAGENFEQAIVEGNYSLCKDIIADVQEVSLEAGRQLNEQLRNTPIEKFAVKSPIQPYDL